MRGMLRFAVTCLLVGLVGLPVAFAQRDDDEAILTSIRALARANDFATAFDRIDGAGSEDLRSKAHAVLAVEYAKNQRPELAKEQFETAKRLAKNGQMRNSDRISVYIFLATEQSKVVAYEASAIASLATSRRLIDSLAGLARDIAIAELAFATVKIKGDKEEALALVQAISDKKFRDKIVKRVQP